MGSGIFGVGHKAERVDPLAVEMDGDDETKLMVADVANIHRISALHLYRVDVGERALHLHGIPPMLGKNDFRPNLQRFRRARMRHGRRFEERFFNDTHGYNL